MLDKLPDDIILYISTHLSVYELIQLNKIKQFRQLYAIAYKDTPISLIRKLSTLNITSNVDNINKFKWLPLYADIWHYDLYKYIPYMKSLVYISYKYDHKNFKQTEYAISDYVDKLIDAYTYKSYNNLSTAYMRDIIRFSIYDMTYNIAYITSIPDHAKYIIDIKDIYITHTEPNITTYCLPNFTRLRKFKFYGKVYLENIHYIIDATHVSLTKMTNLISLPKFTRLDEITLENISVDNIENIIDAKYVTLNYVKNLVSLPKFTRLRHIHLQYININDDMINNITCVTSLTLCNCRNIVNLDKLTNLSRICLLNMDITDDIKLQIETLKKYNNDLLISYEWPK